MPDAVSERPRALQLCGTCAVDGEPVAATGQLLVLLAVLGVRGERGVVREELLELLWPEQGRDSKALDPLLSRLRRIVGPISARGVVRLDGEHVRVDVDTGRTAMREAREAPDGRSRAEAASRAAAAWDGDLAPGCTHPWVEAERVLLREQRGEALEIMARRGLDADATPGDVVAGVRAARELVLIAPLAEEPTARLMELLVAHGDRAAAVVAYDRLRRGLLDELAIAPGPALRRQHARLLQDDEPGRGAPPLPPPLELASARPLFGRERVVEDARAALEEHRLLLVDGPPGIGKTHLAAALARSAHLSGALVLLARGTNTWAGPFAGLAGALRPVVRHQDAGRLRDQLGDRAADLELLLPALLADAPEGRSRPRYLQAAEERFRVFEAICALLEHAATGAGTLLVVDDVQSLDPSSLQLIAQLLATDAVRDLRVLGTARPSAENAAALADAVGGAGRALTLEPLGEQAVRQLVAHDRPALEPSAAAAMTAELLDHTGGTPLLLRAALDTRGRPKDLPAAVAGLVAWAGADVAPLLRCAALDDAGAGIDVLADAAGLSLDRAGSALDRARAAGLMAAGTDVVHASVREALVAELGPSQRAAVHRRLATAHEQAGGAAATIAAHWGRGETTHARARAAVWEHRAAERALESFAAEDAVLHAERALVHLGDADPVRAVELLTLVGRGYNAASRVTKGFVALQEAQRRAARLGRRDLVAQIAVEAPGHRLGTALKDRQVVAVLEQGLDATTPADGVVRARIAGRLAAMLLDGPPARRVALLDEALALARAAADAGAVAEVLLATHTASVHLADPTARGVLLEEAVSLARSVGRTDLVLHAFMLETSDHLEACALDAGRRSLRAWDDAASTARMPFHRWTHAMARPTFSMLDGRLDQAEAHLRRADALAIPLGRDQGFRAASATQWISLAIAAGNAREALAGVDSFRHLGAAPPAWSAGLSYLCAIVGEHDRARDLLDDLLVAGTDSFVDPNRGTALSMYADAAVLCGARAPVLRLLAEGMAERRGTLVVQHFCGAVHGLADARAARLAAALGDPAAAHALTDAAEATAGERPPPLLELDIACARLTAMSAGGDATAAAVLGERTVARALALGMVGAARTVEAFARSAERSPP